MLRGERVGLRARRVADLQVLLDELYDDVPTRVRADSRPWIPIPPEAKQHPYSVEDDHGTEACFSVVDLATEELLGDALLWGIDTHNRLAHIGISLRPGVRGQGYATDVLRVLCRYGFIVRGLHRLQIDTLADNEAARRLAVTAGFLLEGTLRRSAWVSGEFVDEVVFGLLDTEYRDGDGRSGP